MTAPESKRKRYEILRTQLESERASFIPHWRDLSDHISPRRIRLSTSDVNKGDKRNTKIIDNTATLAARTLASGMMGGITSPARPWFRLTTPDPKLSDFGPVKEWLHVVTQRMSTGFLRSNLYQILPTVYKDTGVYATGAMSIEESFEKAYTWHDSFPIGSYMIMKDTRGRINGFIREFGRTVRQLIQQFGRKNPRTGKLDWSNFSSHVKNLWETGKTEAWIDVVHVIKPNDDYKHGNPFSKHKLFSSCYYEKGTSSATKLGYLRDDEDLFLREAGYDYFPILVPRWETTGEDAWGTECPGMQSLGDIKALQLMQKRKSQAIEKMVNPPMTGPTSLRQQKTSILPGDITFVDAREGTQGFRPAHEVNPRIGELVQDIQEHQRRIDRAFFVDLFLMLANTDRREITAREIDERHEEKLLALGPVLEQLNQDLLDPLIESTFQIMLRKSNFELGTGPIPRPPEEIEGLDLKVEYISIMAQAQKYVSLGGIERFTGFVGQIAQANPEILDKINGDELVDVYGDITSVPPGIIRSDEEVAQMREARAQAQAKQAQAERLQAGAAMAKDLSQADLSGDSALSRLADQASAGQLVEAAL